MKLSILVSSAGRRVELLRRFRMAAADLGVGLEVVACDLEPELSAACRVADRAYAVPHCDDPAFFAIIGDIVREHGVRLVVPTIDTELAVYAEAAPELARRGVRVNIASPDVIAVARNKLRTMEVLAAAGVPVPRTAALCDVRRPPCDWAWPALMKPQGGSSSRGLRILNGPQDLPATVEEPMIVQELLDGPEYTVNVFLSAEGVLRAAVPHRRLRVRGGEVEKGRTERHEVLEDYARKIADALPGAAGAMCFQALVDPNKGAKVIEINARFGGGYPLADEAGAKFARWLLEETLSLPSSANNDWREGMLMIRYDEAVFAECT